jgi:thiopeptide-type bacteriocin biosynthesis protein
MSEWTLPDGFVPSGFFALRTPLLPFDELEAWGEGLAAAAAADDPDRLAGAVAADRARLRQRLRAVFGRPEVREALFVAAPDVEERFAVWLGAPESDAGQKIERTLVRYFVRMAGRATPFGLFAGCSVGTVAAETRLRLTGRAGYRRHTRLDVDYLVLLTDALAQAAVRSALRYTVNTSLSPVRGRLRYDEVRRKGDGWTHHRVGLAATDYLQATLGRAREGAAPERLAAGLLEEAPDAAREEAEGYVNELIGSQVLVSELRPAVTGPEPLRGLAARLRDRTEGPAADRIEQARQAMEALDAVGVGAEPERYRRVARLLEGLPGAARPGRLFQVDLVKPVATATLGPAVLDEISRGVAILHHLARHPRQDDLTRFREAVAERYAGREVPLVEALDEETGVGFGTASGGVTDASLLDGFPSTKPTEAAPWGRREALLLGKLAEALSAGAGEIRLTAHDLDALAEPDPPPLPDAFAVRAAVAAASEDALAAGDFRVRLDGLSGPSGARFLGRFCHADGVLHREVERHLRAEEALHPDAVFAEIVHLPEGRVGNILARPVLRACEIPCLGSSGVPGDRRIPVTDLRVAVVGGHVVLRSARLGRRVFPRLTTAHDFSASRGIYRFLCALQAQGVAGELGWDWGPLRDAPFLPRVVTGRLVLARAWWRVGPEELLPLGRVAGATRFRAVQHWRARRRLPRWVALAEGDRELPVDLDNVLAVDALVDLVKGREQATLVELFPGPDEFWARGPEGRFVHELVVPFVRRAAQPGDLPAAEPAARAVSPAAVPRSFPPGSEWLYVKLYTGPATADEVLRDLVRPVLETVQRSGAAERWFFLRYGDPDWHLRLRFHGEPARLLAEVLPAVHAAAAPLLADGQLWRVQLDTYEREVERYGGAEGVVLAERLFQADSEAVLALAAAFPEDPRGDLRWRLALAGMDALLTDLGLDPQTRRTVVRRARDRFASEFAAVADLKHHVGSRFRQERKSLEALLGPVAGSPFDVGLAILRRRSERLAPVVAQLRACAAAGVLTVPLAELAPSYLHMHANRVLRSAHRAQEVFLYDFLVRLDESRAAGR